MSDPFQEHIRNMREGAPETSGEAYLARIARERQADRAERQSALTMPAGKRPHCRHCNRELRLYRWRKAGSPKLYGTYGDNLFCGLTCGYRWALRRA